LGVLRLSAEHDRLHLTYRVRIGGREWEDVDETVRIVRVSCRFGGTRPYFVCPGVVNGTACGRRVAKLYRPGSLRNSWPARHFMGSPSGMTSAET
jgi:hypothetical protein